MCVNKIKFTLLWLKTRSSLFKPTDYSLIKNHVEIFEAYTNTSFPRQRGNEDKYIERAIFYV